MSKISQISILETREISIPSRHTIFQISVTTPVRSWVVSKRYTEFVVLHEKLSQLGSVPMDLPQKSLFNMSKSVVEARMVGLQKYLSAIVSQKDPTLKDSKPFLEFLAVPQGHNTSQVTVNLISRWNLEKESLVAFLSQIKSVLNDKDRSFSNGDSTVAQTKKFQARKGLKQAQELLGNLKENLNREGMAEGEYQRKLDLLYNMQREIEKLQESANASSNRSSVNSSQLFPATAKPTLKSTRKFGVETEETRTLDNNQLLQLQARQLDMQDKALDSLTDIVRRQKEISLVVSQELDHQNALLEQVNESVDQVEDKMKIADKKVHRILRG